MMFSMFTRNTMTRKFSLTAAALLALGGTLALGAPRAARADDIVDTAVKAGQFKTLAAALKAAGLVEALKGPGPFTVFAPTDAAFAKLPKATLASLLKPANKATLAKILEYHVLKGEITAKQVLAMKSPKTPPTLEGQPLTVKVSHGTVHVNNAKVIKTDIKADNGIIHVIDTVLLPPAASKMHHRG